MSNASNMTTRQVAARLGVTQRTVARWVEGGKLSPVDTFPLGPHARCAYLFNAEQIDRLAMGDDLMDGGVTAALTEQETDR